LCSGAAVCERLFVTGWGAELLEACGFCGRTTGPFTRVEGLFEVLMCPGCLRDRGRSAGPYPAMSDEEHRAALDLLPSWVLAQKVSANRALVAAVRQRLAQGQPVARMYQADGLAWLERQADLAEAISAARQAARPGSQPSPAASPATGSPTRGRVCCRDERA
jgi:hypothetical protein